MKSVIVGHEVSGCMAFGGKFHATGIMDYAGFVKYKFTDAGVMTNFVPIRL